MFSFMKQAAPELMILGPGTAGEPQPRPTCSPPPGPDLDAVSYHYYGALSQRCIGNEHAGGGALGRLAVANGSDAEFYKALRDRFEPGKPIWLTETADAACGGNPWAASFLDTFRYLDQLGRLARAGVQVVMHNTLAASDYGLLDERRCSPDRTTGARCSGGA